jgi:hypothetical protein
MSSKVRGGKCGRVLFWEVCHPMICFFAMVNDTPRWRVEDPIARFDLLRKIFILASSPSRMAQFILPHTSFNVTACGLTA